MLIALAYAIVSAAITYACLDASERLSDRLTDALSPQDEQAGAFGDVPFLPAALCFDPFHANGDTL